MVAYIIDATEHPGYTKARHSLPILVGDRLLWLLAIVVTNTTLTATHAASRRKPQTCTCRWWAPWFSGRWPRRTYGDISIHARARLDINAIYFRVANAVQGRSPHQAIDWWCLHVAACHKERLSQLASQAIDSATASELLTRPCRSVTHVFFWSVYYTYVRFSLAENVVSVP
jgi:hypothetical protein